MAYIKINTFGGLAPRTSPRLLRDDLATVANDVNLESGRIVPIKENSDHLTLSNSSRKSVFKYTDSPERWLQFDEEVDVVRSPIPGETNDTVYWSGVAVCAMLEAAASLLLANTYSEGINSGSQAAAPSW